MKIGVLSMWKETRCRFRVGVLQVMLDVDLASPVMGIAGMVTRESDIMIIYRGCLGVWVFLVNRDFIENFPRLPIG